MQIFVPYLGIFLDKRTKSPHFSKSSIFPELGIDMDICDIIATTFTNPFFSYSQVVMRNLIWQIFTDDEK